MELAKFFKVMVIVTVLALSYIHIQMQIVDLAYRGNRKQQQIRKLIEENGSATYKILMMKSAHNLGVIMLDNESGMQFADANDVVQIATSRDFSDVNQSDEQIRLSKKANPLLSLLSFGVEAEAEANPAE